MKKLKRQLAKHVAAVTAFTAAEDPQREVEKWKNAFTL